MRTFSMLATLSIFLSSTAFASTTKVCFGVGEAKGERFRMDVTRDSAIVTEINGTSYEYPAAREVKGKDGKTYLSFNTFDDPTWTEFIVEESLLLEDGQGTVKYRWKGEGFAQRSFFCRKDRF